MKGQWRTYLLDDLLVGWGHNDVVVMT